MENDGKFVLLLNSVKSIHFLMIFLTRLTLHIKVQITFKGQLSNPSLQII